MEINNLFFFGNLSYYGVLMSSFSTSLSAFFINNSGTLKGDFEPNYGFFLRKILFFRFRIKLILFWLCLKTVLKRTYSVASCVTICRFSETYDKHKDKAKVRSVLAKFGSAKGLLKQCSSRIEGFGEKLDESKIILQEIQNL